ncbi:hypothetical protein V5799_011416 [Amblyomma americanum]|uniref:Peptidase M13 N-terminal domain-containing protein n=1 Tax=Amblyomma americanum TaxID=6943 RepID=A0AAQ4EHC5_AMBAM
MNKRMTMIFRITLGILCVAICASESMLSIPGAPGSKTEVCCEPDCPKVCRRGSIADGKDQACGNFYENVCGKWKGSLELERKPLKEKAVKDLADLLEAACVQPTESLNATDKLINAYQSCTRQAKNIQALKESVKSVLDGYSLGQWPLHTNATSENKSTYEEILKKVGPLPLFIYSVSRDKSGPIITVKRPTDFYVSDIDSGDEYSDEYDYYDKKNEEAYKEFITGTMSLLDNGDIHERSKAADEIISLEKNLSKVSISVLEE